MCIDKVDKLSKILSSNLYENFFSILVKFTEGKKVSTEKSNNSIILQHFVDGLRSNADFLSTLLNEVGTYSNLIRNKEKRNSKPKKNIRA